MDMFVQKTTGGGCTQARPKTARTTARTGSSWTTTTATPSPALWNYAQHYALNDNSYDNQFGPSTPGRSTWSAATPKARSRRRHAGNVAGGVLRATPNRATTSAPSPRRSKLDDRQREPSSCRGATAEMTSKNVGDLLNERGVTWGWFQGGFEPTAGTAGNRALCAPDDAEHRRRQRDRATSCTTSRSQYYASTANLAPRLAELGQRSRPQRSDRHAAGPDASTTSTTSTGSTQALEAGNMPQVSFLKAPASENGHPGNSDPLDEQKFIVEEINTIENSQYWNNTAIFIAYDDSDGWYDHQVGPTLFPSHTAPDRLTGAGACQFTNESSKVEHAGRCGLGPRLPLHADLAVREVELRRQHAHRAVVDPAVHRGQLEPRLGSAPAPRMSTRVRSTTCSNSATPSARRR